MKIDTEIIWKLLQMGNTWGIYAYRHKLWKFETL